MKTFFKNLLYIFSVSSILFFSSCKDEEIKPIEIPQPDPSGQKGAFEIKLDHKFGASAFAFGTPYNTNSAEEVTFNKLNYYISAVKLIKADNSVWEEPESYHLVKFQNGVSQTLTINNTPAGAYKGLSFTIGVDSLRNVSGSQTGALDPANQMFWSWNSGYIFVKAEGTSPQSTGMNNSFSYHLGGFRNSNQTNANQPVSFTFDGAVIDVKQGSKPSIHLNVNVKNLFDGSTTLSIASNPMTHMPGAMAVSLAKNFADGFMFDHIHN